MGDELTHEERIRRFERLMRQIRAHRTSEEDTQRMNHIKQEAKLEIELRYKRSFNTYRFPKYDTSDSTGSPSPDQKALGSQENILFNLHSQRVVDPSPEDLPKVPLQRRSLQNTSKSPHRDRPSPSRIVPVFRMRRKRIIESGSQSPPGLEVNRSSSNSKAIITKMPLVHKLQHPPEMKSTKSQHKSLRLKPLLESQSKMMFAPPFVQNTRIPYQVRQNRLVTEQAEALTIKRKQRTSGYEVSSSKKLETEAQEPKIVSHLERRVDKYLTNDTRQTHSITLQLKNRNLLHLSRKEYP